jgi:hypothetical protein
LTSCVGGSKNGNTIKPDAGPVSTDHISEEAVWTPFQRYKIAPLLDQLRAQMQEGYCPATDTFSQCAHRLANAYDYGALVLYYDLLEELNCPGSQACVVKVMRDNGAAPEAVAFFDQTGWILTDLHSVGSVALGVALNPWLANGNYQFILLNGKPPKTFPMYSSRLDISADPHYGELLELTRQRNGSSEDSIMVWPSDIQLESSSLVPDNAPRFVFQFNIVGGCHVCATGYAARFAFDYGADGTLVRVGLLGICRYREGKPDDVPDVTGCPPAKSP